MLGTMVLVLMGCGAAVSLGCDAVNDMASVVGTAMAFGLAVVAMAYTIGGISGCHINPAITLAMYFCRRMSAKDAGMYILFQVIGGILGAAVLYVLTLGTTMQGAMGANSPAFDVSHTAAFVAEFVFTFVFVLVVLGATSRTNGATNNFAGLAIGLALVLVHLACIRYTGTSVNPARSIGPAIFAGGEALATLYLFVLAPLGGGALAAGVWMCLSPDND